MKLSKILAPLLALCLFASTACASTFIDAHGNEIQLDDSLEAYAAVTLVGANDAARQGETNLGDLWTDALRWFAVSGEINAAFDEDDVKAGQRPHRRRRGSRRRPVERRQPPRGYRGGHVRRGSAGRGAPLPE